MMHAMRTTIDLPPAVHRRVRELAAQRGQSLSSVLADLTVRGLAQLDAPVELSTDARTGLPVLSLGRRITSAEVADVLDEE
jgi:predicted transcriptional regulator